MGFLRKNKVIAVKPGVYFSYKLDSEGSHQLKALELNLQEICVIEEFEKAKVN